MPVPNAKGFAPQWNIGLRDIISLSDDNHYIDYKVLIWLSM